MKMKPFFHWYPVNFGAKQEDLLSLKLVRREYDALFHAMTDECTPSIANTPLIYALIRKTDERAFAEAQQQAIRTGDLRYLESRDLPRVLAFAEVRWLEVTRSTSADSESATSAASLAYALERRGTVLDGWYDTVEQICTSGTLAGMLCDCSSGIPELTPIMLNYQAPTQQADAGYLTDVTAFTKLFNRASSL